MSRERSPAVGQVYGVKRVATAWGVSRATLYRHRAPKEAVGRRGPKPLISDQGLLSLIEEDLASSLFHGEGHRKVHARLRRRGHCMGRQRVLRVMRENKLLSPHRVSQGKAKAHDGRITTDAPNQMWATDAVKLWTIEEGWVWMFSVVEHWNAECLGWHITKKGDRFAALEALNQAIESQYAITDRGVARGLSLRSDHGSQFKSEDYRDRLDYLGVHHSLGYVKEPETNGVIERFHRTLKDQVIHGYTYQNVAELRTAVGKFIENYNEEWLIAKMGYVSPFEARMCREISHAA